MKVFGWFEIPEAILESSQRLEDFMTGARMAVGVDVVVVMNIRGHTIVYGNFKTINRLCTRKREVFSFQNILLPTERMGRLDYAVAKDGMIPTEVALLLEAEAF